MVGRARLCDDQISCELARGCTIRHAPRDPALRESDISPPTVEIGSTRPAAVDCGLDAFSMQIVVWINFKMWYLSIYVALMPYHKGQGYACGLPCAGQGPDGPSEWPHRYMVSKNKHELTALRDIQSLDLDSPISFSGDFISRTSFQRIWNLRRNARQNPRNVLTRPCSVPWPLPSLDHNISRTHWHAFNRGRQCEWRLRARSFKASQRDHLWSMRHCGLCPVRLGPGLFLSGGFKHRTDRHGYVSKARAEISIKKGQHFANHPAPSRNVAATSCVNH